MWSELLQQVGQGDFKALARCISLVENKVEGYEAFLQGLPGNSNVPVIGITGPPGAGKSTLANNLISLLTSENKKVGVLCIDPSSAFHSGALLGDRIRMRDFYNQPGVFIRSLSTRGTLGGLHPQIIEVLSVMQAAAFDYIIIETVGVGQSEIEIAGLADTTVVVLVPEGGDEIQTMKAGLMEIADIFVVNKADRPAADTFLKNLHIMQAGVHSKSQIPILKTVASENKGTDVLYCKIKENITLGNTKKRNSALLAERAYYLIREHRMKGIDKMILREEIENEMKNPAFNLYKFLTKYLET